MWPRPAFYGTLLSFETFNPSRQKDVPRYEADPTGSEEHWQRGGSGQSVPCQDNPAEYAKLDKYQCRYFQ
jgi:hypothetical protein